MKTPSARAGLNVHLDGALALKRIVEFFYTETDGIMGSSSAPTDATLAEEFPAISGMFSHITGHGGLQLENRTTADLERRFPAVAIDEATKMNIINTDMDNSGSTDELPEVQPPSSDNPPIAPEVSVIKTRRSTITVESR